MFSLSVQIIQVYLIFFLFSLVAISQRNNALRYKCYDCKEICLIIFLIFIVGFRNGNFFRDYSAYEHIFYNNELYRFEPSFRVISILVKKFFLDDIKFLMLMYATISILLKSKAIKEMSSYIALSFVVFIGDLFLLHECTQIRAGVAVSFLLLSIKEIYDKNFKRFIIYVIIASMFHVSSILILPLYLLNSRKSNKFFWYGVIVFGYIFSFLKFDLMNMLAGILDGDSYIENKLHSYTLQNTEKNNTVNVFGILNLSKLFIMFILFEKSKLLNKKNKYSILLLKSQALSIFSLCFFSQNIAAGLRISEFYSVVDILLFPSLVTIIKEKTFAKSLVILLSLIWLSMRIFRYGLIA